MICIMTNSEQVRNVFNFNFILLIWINNKLNKISKYFKYLGIKDSSPEIQFFKNNNEYLSVLCTFKKAVILEYVQLLIF